MDEAESHTVTLEFPASMEGEFLELVERTNKALARHKLPPLTVSLQRVEREVMVECSLLDSELMTMDYGAKRVKVKRIVATVEHPVGRLKWEGYTYEGLVSSDEGTVAVVAAAGRPDLTGRFDLSLDFECSHCHTRRERTLKAIFTKDADGTPFFIGRQCAKEYWGLDIMDIIARFDQEVTTFSGEATNRHASIIAEGKTVFPLALHVSLYSIKTAGFVSQKRAEEDYTKTATAAVVRDYINAFKYPANTAEGKKEQDKMWAKLNAWSGAVGKEYLDKTLKAITDYYQQTFVPTDDFGSTLKAAFDEACAARPGVIAAGVATWLRQFEPRVEVEVEGAKNEPWGTVGQRGNATVTVLSIDERQGEKRFPYDSGLYYIVKMITKEGQRLVWFASAKPEMQVGKSYEVKASVKRHGEFKGQVETAVCRVAVKKPV